MTVTRLLEAPGSTRTRKQYLHALERLRWHIGVEPQSTENVTGRGDRRMIR